MYFRHIFYFYSLICVLCFCLVVFLCFLVLFGIFVLFVVLVPLVRAKSFCKKKKKEFKTALITSFILLLQIWELKLPQWYQKRSEQLKVVKATSFYSIFSFLFPSFQEKRIYFGHLDSYLVICKYFIWNFRVKFRGLLRFTQELHLLNVLVENHETGLDHSCLVRHFGCKQVNAYFKLLQNTNVSQV